MLTGCQKDMPKDRLTDRQTDRQTEKQIEDKTTFQLSYQNKSCSECQEDARNTEGQQDVKRSGRKSDRQTAGFRKTSNRLQARFFDEIFCEKNLPKSAPPPKQKMPFSSDLCHFKTTLAQFQKKIWQNSDICIVFSMCPPQIFCEILI